MSTRRIFGITVPVTGVATAAFGACLRSDNGFITGPSFFLVFVIWVIGTLVGIGLWVFDKRRSTRVALLACSLTMSVTFAVLSWVWPYPGSAPLVPITRQGSGRNG